jgi:hypothetical protein
MFRYRGYELINILFLQIKTQLYKLNISLMLTLLRSQCNSVSLETRLRTGRLWFDSRQRQLWDYLSSTSLPDSSGAHPDSYSTDTGGWFFLLVIKRPEREADPSPPRLRMRGAILLLPSTSSE